MKVWTILTFLCSVENWILYADFREEERLERENQSSNNNNIDVDQVRLS